MKFCKSCEGKLNIGEKYDCLICRSCQLKYPLENIDRMIVGHDPETTDNITYNLFRHNPAHDNAAKNVAHPCVDSGCRIPCKAISYIGKNLTVIYACPCGKIFDSNGTIIG
jgi:DNA-directed RNA polymerase subunit M/transcription elongation factor TFIIS